MVEDMHMEAKKSISVTHIHTKVVDILLFKI